MSASPFDEPYIWKEYPKMLYRGIGEQLVVADSGAELEAIVDGWEPADGDPHIDLDASEVKSRRGRPPGSVKKPKPVEEEEDDADA